MRKSESKLQTLMRLLSHREAAAKRALVHRRQAMDGASSRKDELDGLQQENRQRLAAAGGVGVSARDLQLWRRFNQSLDEVVDVQGLQVERLRYELEQAQSACMAALVRRRGGERLEEAAQRREAELVRRRERVSASERAARRHHATDD
jgi:flagellar export protein FliJ